MSFNKIIDKLTEKSKLQSEINELKILLAESEKELVNSKQVINKLQVENKGMSAQLKTYGVTLNKLEKETKALMMQVQEMQEKEAVYRGRFGNVEVIEQKNDEVGQWDVDKSFFDQIEKIKGNPFNSNQVQAIRYNMEKNLRIIAGAGSGKTETICAKTAYLMSMENVHPSRICMVTFTRKAANEMKERVNLFLDTENSFVAIGTFHSIFQTLFNQLIKQVPAYAAVGVVGQKSGDSDEKYNKLFRSLIKQYNLFNFDKHGEKSLKERIDYWISLGYSPEQMRDMVAKHYDSIEEESAYPISQRVYDFYRQFNDIRAEEQIVVFDDYLLNLYHALKNYESAREFIQGKFDYIFIDEFQDINPLQMEIVKLISPPNENGSKLIIVGDDDQSIYAFRGSDPSYIKNFNKLYDTYTIELMTNYRSQKNIVQAGNRVIAANAHDRINKIMTPFHQEVGEAFIWAANDQTDEAEWIVTKAQEIGKKSPFVFNGKSEPINYRLSNILYRSVGQLQSVYQVLDSRNVPYVIENNEDVMGIFNISDFKFVFRYWSDLMSVPNNTELFSWKPILLNAANAHYISNVKFSQFLHNSGYKNLSQLFDDFSGFIKKERPKSDIQIVRNYLDGLKSLSEGKSVLLNEIIEPFLQLPKLKKEMSKEEMDWIKKECSHYKTWSSLIAYHDRLKGNQSKMKKYAELYHKGEYNALYFLTIHKSKGLAFENVFIIGVYDDGLPTKRSVPLKSVNVLECKEKAEPPSTIEEERRLMYVAVTRAKKNLYVTFPKSIQGKPIKRSIFLKELNLELRNG